MYHAVIRAASSARRWIFPDVPQGGLLHLSDTPRGTFCFIKRLIGRTRPAVIIHTGDLVDDIKLELRPRERDAYAQQLARLLPILESAGASVHVMLGNHDDEEAVRNLGGGVVVHPREVALSWAGKVLRGAHRAEDALEGSASFYLFGHDLSVKSSPPDDPVQRLNGLEHVHLISPAGEVLRLRWPWGTEDARLLRHRCGI